MMRILFFLLLIAAYKIAEAQEPIDIFRVGTYQSFNNKTDTTTRMSLGGYAANIVLPVILKDSTIVLTALNFQQFDLHPSNTDFSSEKVNSLTLSAGTSLHLGKTWRCILSIMPAFASGSDKKFGSAFKLREVVILNPLNGLSPDVGYQFPGVDSESFADGSHPSDGGMLNPLVRGVNDILSQPAIDGIIDDLRIVPPVDV